MEYIIDNPNWKDKSIVELCMNDCENCQYNYVSESDKIREIVVSLYSIFEKKFDKIINPALYNYMLLGGW
ncbi:MAG: hypothetical protein ACFFDF_08020 [Candidatus Odinarchaeota archaeon]